MTISNSDFDGNTDSSSSCDGHHYWSFIFYGTTRFSMLNNYVHGTSGCSPKIGGEAEAHVVAHVANNYWGNNSGHSFEIGANAWVLAEDNYFSNTRMPLFNKTNDGALYAADSQDECTKYLGRACKANVLVDSGIFPSRNGETALETIKTIPTFVDYAAGTSQTSNSEQQTTQTSDSEQQQVQQPVAGTVKPSTETSQTSIQWSDVENVWAETTGNFGVGKLD